MFKALKRPFGLLSLVLSLTLSCLVIASEARAEYIWETRGDVRLLADISTDLGYATLLAAENVPVATAAGTRLYSVAFFPGSFEDQYNQAANNYIFRPFSTHEDAFNASQALLDHVFLDAEGGSQWDSIVADDGQAYHINGCSSNVECGVITPYGEVSTDFDGQQRVNQFAAFNRSASYIVGDGVFIGRSEVDRSTEDGTYVSQGQRTWALWVAPVPEPSTYAMMAIGLLGIAGMRRRQNKA